MGIEVPDGDTVERPVAKRIVSVSDPLTVLPLAVPVQRASYTFKVFLVSLGVIFLFTMIALNLMLYGIVIRRVKRLARLADEVSLGNLEAGEFRTKTHDEIGVLTEALGRMKTSMVQALKMLEGGH